MRNLFMWFSMVLFILTLPSCKKFVDIDPPVTKLSNESVFENSSLTTAAQLGIYNQMSSGGMSYFTSSSLGMYADELSSYSTSGVEKDYYTNGLSPGTSAWPWPYYTFIYQANAIIEGLQNSKSIASPIKQQLTGESLFVRAYCFFYLLNCFGDVPLAITTDYQTNILLTRSGTDKVYDQIVQDLQAAKGMLNSQYVDGTDTVITSERIRPNSAAASALLARVYLFRGQYSLAETESNTVINNSLYNLEADLNSVFLRTSREAIWQLGTVNPAPSDTNDGYNFILPSSPANGSTKNNRAVSPQLLNSFETGDQRKINWIDSITTSNPMATYYYPFKYKVRTPAQYIENVTVLRLAEQYLIRAEARTQLDNIAGTLSDLNTIRHRAGLGDYNGATDKNSLLAAILHERQVELFTEWGHRWLDLKRTGNASAVMSLVAPAKGSSWNPDEHQLLFPIPQTDINTGPNLRQNSGY